MERRRRRRRIGNSFSLTPLEELVNLAGPSVKSRPERKKIPIIDTTGDNSTPDAISPGNSDVHFMELFNGTVEVEVISPCQSPSKGHEGNSTEVEAEMFLRSLGLNSHGDPADLPLGSVDNDVALENNDIVSPPENGSAAELEVTPEVPSVIPKSHPTRKRNVIPDPKTWSKEEAKRKRMKGEHYMGYTRKDKKSNAIMLHNTPKAGRIMGPVCPSSSLCRKRVNRHCHNIEYRHRAALFNQFWQDMDWGEKKMFVASLVNADEPKRKIFDDDEKNHKPKGVTYSYFLLIENKKMQVCQTTFLHTFGLKNSTARHWLADYWDSKKQSESLNHESSNDEGLAALAIQPSYAKRLSLRKEVLEEFLNVLPKLPSHYCRASSTRLYFHTDITSWAQLYGVLYKDYCRKNNVMPLSTNYFHKVRKVMNLSIFHPKKDQCDLCTGYKHQYVSKEKYDKHIMLKNQARDAKTADKALGEAGKAHVICCDMMAVKLLPCIATGVAYYKMKLAIHNFTIYNLGNHDAICYWFTENECSLVSSVFATCMVEEVNRLLDCKEMDVVIYSDGCGYQNRNAVLSNALLSVSMKRNVTITQKFLERGHTQMEGDSVHSVIETAMRKKDGIYLPHEMVQITKEARKNPTPYRAKMMNHDNFYNYNAENKVKYSSIRPGNKPNEPVVTDIRCLQYTPDGLICYKLRYDEDFKQLPRRPRNINLLDFPPLFEDQLPIPKDKWDDLQSLKMYIPKDCHHFFNHLPHMEQSYKKTIGREKKEQNKKQARPLSPNPGPSGLKKFKNKKTERK